MSSSSYAYIVSPNDPPPAGLTEIPSPTQLNGTGPLVDLVPRVLSKGDNTTIALSNTPAAFTTLYTFPEALEAGTYIINYTLECSTGSPTNTNWNTDEYIYTETFTSTSFPADWSCIASFQPYYQSFLPPQAGVFFGVSGFIQLNSTLTPIIRIARNGTLSASKFAAVIFVSCQKVE